MLYELAWVYVRLGDVQRAERALEVLMVSDPNSQYIGDGTLLRADLLLRAGAFDRALQLYQSVLAQYDPMRAKVESFLDSTKDVSVYYDKLAQQQLDLLDQNEQLPAARHPLGARGRGRAAGVRRHRRRERVQDAHPAVEPAHRQAHARSMGASNRVRAFPELEAGETAALVAPQPRVARAADASRTSSIDEEPGDLGGEIGQVRAAAARAHGRHRGAAGRRRRTSASASSRGGRSGTRSRRSSRDARSRSTRSRRRSTGCAAC